MFVTIDYMLVAFASWPGIGSYLVVVNYQLEPILGLSHASSVGAY